MAFCSSCGAKLAGDERFCAACGADVSLKAATPAAASAATPAPAPTAIPLPPPAMPAPPRPVAPMQPAAVPGPYAAPGPIPGQFPGQFHGPIPVVVGMQQGPAKSGGKMWTVIVIVALVAGGYYYNKHKPGAATPPAAPGQGGAPGQPGVQGQPGAPAQPGTPAQPGFTPSQGQPGPNGPLVQQEVFVGRWDAVNGYVQISQGRWTNNANAMMQSATLKCVQYDANGAALSQMQTTLNGPVHPRAISYFGPFQMGSVARYLSKVNCSIVAVTPANP